MPRRIHVFLKLPRRKRTHCDTTRTKPFVNAATIINRITRVATDTYTSRKIFIDQADPSLARTVRPTLLMNATDSVRLSVSPTEVARGESNLNSSWQPRRRIQLGEDVSSATFGARGGIHAALRQLRRPPFALSFRFHTWGWGRQTGRPPSLEEASHGVERWLL